MSDRVIQSESQLNPPAMEEFIDEVARYFGGDKSVAACFLDSYNYHLDCRPSAASEEDVLDYLELFLPSNATF